MRRNRVVSFREQGSSERRETVGFAYHQVLKEGSFSEGGVTFCLWRCDFDKDKQIEITAIFIVLEEHSSQQ